MAILALPLQSFNLQLIADFTMINLLITNIPLIIMSKKKKKKYYQQAVSNVSSTASQAISGVTSAVTSSVASIAPVKASPTDKLAPLYSAHAEEYRMVRSDLIRVAVVNGLFLVAVLALYYANRSNPFLEAWYSRIFH